MARRAPHIISVEDNRGVSRLLAEALAEAGLWARLEVIGSGYEAIARLEGVEPYGGAPLPDLLILDLNLPGIYGHELLSLVRDHERLRDLKTMILTASTDPEEAAFCRARGVDAFLSKPMDMDGYRGIVSAIERLLSEDGFGVDDGA
jgi:CheY-like chemotaxis protein